MIFVLAYPEFDPGLAGSIARFRSMHEPERARLVPPHVTLVFGLRSVNTSQFVASCEQIAKLFPQIDLSFDHAQVALDPFEKKHKLFLMCSAGRDEIIALHARLYDGPHQCDFDPRVPYQPHMTIATNSDVSVIEGLNIREIGKLPLSGRIGALEVVSFADNRFIPLRTIPLKK